MKLSHVIYGLMVITMIATAPAYSAYHHEGESDAVNFTASYPEKANTKLDHCALCHSGGEYQKSSGKTVSLGSCQWCHFITEYGTDYGAENAKLSQTINAYGKAYHNNGRDQSAIRTIEAEDSDSDGYSNIDEINADRYPGDIKDDPSLTEAPSVIFSMDELEAMPQHTQFLLMNTSRSGDFYAEYTGVPMEELLKAVDIRPEASGITVFAPDGWSQYHPLRIQEDPELYHIFGSYPMASYNHDSQAEGWCDFTAPSGIGRSHGDPIAVENGLKSLLAIKREGANLDPGVLNIENKLDGSGPFRVIVPQKAPCPPDQSSKSDNTDVTWPYNHDWDHNAGACTRSVTIIKVEPLPEGTTDINILEAGWQYIGEQKIIIYGAINSDVDDDGIVDSQDTDTETLTTPDKKNLIRISSNGKRFEKAVTLEDSDPSLSQEGKPADAAIPYGVFKFEIPGLTPGEEVTVTLTLPDDVPETSVYYKITSNGWSQIPLGSNNGDNIVTITLKDGDPTTDADEKENGIIVDPGALVTGVSQTSSSADTPASDNSDSCFISTLR